MYCPWCGKEMVCETKINNKSSDSKSAAECWHCKKCDTPYLVHGIDGMDTAPGDSWSVTYLK